MVFTIFLSSWFFTQSRSTEEFGEVRDDWIFDKGVSRGESICYLSNIFSFDCLFLENLLSLIPYGCYSEVSIYSVLTSSAFWRYSSGKSVPPELFLYYWL